MKKKILGMFVCMMLIATAVPAVESLKNSTINSTVPSIPLTSMKTNWTEMHTLLASDGAGAIFVSTAGSDTTGNGTIGNPFATIQKGINVAQPGDTVYVRGGVYNQLASFVRSGTEGNPITLKAYGNEIATMDGRNFTIAHRQGIIDDQWYSYINIFNMNVQYSDECGISVRDGPCGHIRIEGCSIYDTDQSGICSYGGDTLPYTELHNITIKNNRVGKSVTDMEGQEAITVRFTKNFEVCYNYIYHMGNIGIDAKNGSSYGIIHHNEINQSGADNPWVSSAIYIDSGCWSLNRVCHNVDIYDNLIHGHCNGIKIGCESGGRVENCSIYNNIVYEARVGFRDDNNGLTDGIRYIKNNVKVINNNFINCNWSVFITEPGQNIKNLTLRNNIMSSINNIFQWNTPPSPEEVNNDHNLYEKDPGVSFRGTDYIIGNPGFVNEAAHDYRLTEYSTARNNGSSVNAPNFDYIGTPRPQGSGVDIGAYEYIGSNVVPSFGTPNPANNSNDNPLSLTWSISISDANGDTFNWTINCSNGQHNQANGASNGTKSLSLSGLAYSTTYKVWVNATDPAGSGLYIRRWYTFTTRRSGNNPPVFGTPSPANDSTGNPLGLTWSIPINDLEGNAFSWTIQCSNGQGNSSLIGASNGTKSLPLSGLAVTTTYKVWVNATDSTGSGLYTRKWYTLKTMESPPPNQPMIYGPADGKAGVSYTYNFVAVDPDGDDVYYRIEWGDGSSITEWIGPYPSGKLVIVSHTFSKTGICIIKCQAKDSYNALSNWGTFEVTMPVSINLPFHQLIEKLFEQFPHAFPILRHLLRY